MTDKLSEKELTDLERLLPAYARTYPPLEYRELAALVAEVRASRSKAAVPVPAEGLESADAWLDRINETGVARRGFVKALEARDNAVRRALLDDLQNIAEGLAHDDVIPDIGDAYDEACRRLRAKYAPPPAEAPESEAPDAE